jgi:hypothetical protein
VEVKSLEGWSISLQNKSELKYKLFTLLADLKISGIDVKIIHCDDFGENKSFNESCQTNGHNIKFECSENYQHNQCKVKQKFQNLYVRIGVTLNNGGLEVA